MSVRLLCILRGWPHPVVKSLGITEDSPCDTGGHRRYSMEPVPIKWEASEPIILTEKADEHPAVVSS